MLFPVWNGKSRGIARDREVQIVAALARPSLTVGFAGPIGAGKTTGARYLADTYGFQYLRYSEVLAEFAILTSVDRGPLQQEGWRVMSSGLQVQLNERLIAKIDVTRDSAIDGLRHPIDDASLRAAFAPAYFLIYVDATRRRRWSRNRVAGRFSNVSDFLSADVHPVEGSIRLLKSLAFAVVTNEASIELYRAALDQAVTEIIHRFEETS